MRWQLISALERSDWRLYTASAAETPGMKQVQNQLLPCRKREYNKASQGTAAEHAKRAENPWAEPPTLLPAETSQVPLRLAHKLLLLLVMRAAGPCVAFSPPPTGPALPPLPPRFSLAPALLCPLPAWRRMGGSCLGDGWWWQADRHLFLSGWQLPARQLHPAQHSGSAGHSGLQHIAELRHRPSQQSVPPATHYPLRASGVDAHQRAAGKPFSPRLQPALAALTAAGPKLGVYSLGKQTGSASAKK